MKGGGSRGRKEHSGIERWEHCRRKEGGDEEIVRKGDKAKKIR